MVEEIKATNIPVIVSTGMISKKELDTVLDILKDQVEYILSCTSTYPTKVIDINMHKMISLKKIYGSKYRIGFSNHSPGLTFILMAAALEAEMIEFHVTLDRSMYGSDQASSIEVPGIFKIMNNVKDMEKAWGSNKIECAKSERVIRDKLLKKILK